MEPKVFISYSWSSAAHQSLVRHWADDLIADGIEVAVDMYDLKEGDDKFAYMERMVTDKSVTHVLVVCDKIYSEKADGRKAGVGTETQIISKEIYEKVEQSKFIPVVCEFGEDNVACVPTFLRSRIWINFYRRKQLMKIGNGLYDFSTENQNTRNQPWESRQHTY